MSAHGQGNRAREARCLSTITGYRQGKEMRVIDPEIQYVVGIDVAKRSHAICAIKAPTGTVHLRPRSIAATADGYAELRSLLQGWGPKASILLGLEATGCLWEPLYESLTQEGYSVLVLNPRQTASWATSLGLRAKTDGIDAHTLARGILAGYARASSLPSETVQELRALTRARQDLVHSQTAAKQRLRDELIVLFPELPQHTPANCDLFTPALLRLLGRYSSAQAVATASLEELTVCLEEVSEQRWGEQEAQALQDLATTSTASTRAVRARGLVVQTMAQHLLDLQARLTELEGAIAEVLAGDDEGRRLQTLPGVGPIIAATMRAELGDVARFAHVDQVVAYAGLDPRTRQSGAFVGQKHLSKRGPGALRHVLYLATLNAVRNRSEWRDRYQRLLDRGRAKKEALTILSRALLRVAYHVLRTGTVYDSSFLQSSPSQGRT
jgi:transposase